MDHEDRIPTAWLSLRATGAGSVEVAGTPSAVLGHQIPQPAADRPSGVYVQWHWDGQSLTVRNDRAGMGQLLYAVLDGGQGIALSPHVEQLLQLGADRTPDEGALSVLIRLGFHLGVDTPYQAIRALPPNATLTWRPGDWQVTGGPHIPPVADVPRAVAVARYIELFRQSIDRRPPIPGATVLPLTGGQDSRHILFELCHRGTPPDLCMTVRPYRQVTYDDATVAAELASQLGVPHRQIDLQGSLVAEDFRKYRRLGPLSDEGGWTSVMLDHLRAFRCAYDGIAGDMLSSGYLAGIRYDDSVHALVARQDWCGLAERIVDHFSAPEPAMAPLLKRASFRDHGRTYVQQRVEAELQQVAAAGHPLALFIINHRTRREIAMMSQLLCAEVNPYYAPYLDEPLFDFLASLPAEHYARGQWFHREAIAQGYPQWAQLPYLDKERAAAQVPVSPWQVVHAIGQLHGWTARYLPSLLDVVSRWGVHRLASRGGNQSAPRRVMQHFLVLEQMLRRYRS